MKLCSQCKNPLEGQLAFTEEGQEDYPWCKACTDYVDAIEKIMFLMDELDEPDELDTTERDESSRSAILNTDNLTPTELYNANREILKRLDYIENTLRDLPTDKSDPISDPGGNPGGNPVTTGATAPCSRREDKHMIDITTESYLGPSYCKGCDKEFTDQEEELV